MEIERETIAATIKQAAASDLAAMLAGMVAQLRTREVRGACPRALGACRRVVRIRRDEAGHMIGWESEWPPTLLFDVRDRARS